MRQKGRDTDGEHCHLETLFACRSPSDEEFDSIYPLRVRDKSVLHWTPIKVIERIIEILGVNSHTKVLDVGSGPGKFCIVGSLLSEGVFHGVEQRRYLFSVADKIARKNDFTRVKFFHADAFAMDWSDYDVIYFFNPFQEHTAGTDEYRIDDSIAFKRRHFSDYIFSTFRHLSDLKMGTKVVTYHGMGGRLPESYRLILGEKIGEGNLCCWKKIE